MNRRLISFHRAARKDRQGMVLFEVVTALFVFTLVAFALVIALNGSFDAAKERNEIDAAMRGLSNQLELLHQGRLLPGETDLPDDGSGIRYRREVVQQQMLDQKKQPVPNMYEATVTATWKSGTENEERDVSELIYQP
jgi:hypothetical protein